LFDAIRRRDITYNPHAEEKLMTTIWGRLERIAEGLPEGRWVQVRTAVPGSGTILTCIIIGEQTRIARGIEQVSLANLREGEFVGITFRAARAGVVKADTIYARPEFVMSESKSSSSAWPQTSAQGSMQQAPAGPESVCCYFRSIEHERWFRRARRYPFDVDEPTAQAGGKRRCSGER
jgi:hypothetical protein